MAKIRETFLQLKRATRAKGTLTVYASDWKAFCEWCKLTNRSSLPATAETLALYVAACLDPERDLRITTVEQHAAAVRYYHLQAGMQPPDRTDARAVIAGARRQRNEHPRERAPLTAKQIRRICDKLYLQAQKGSLIAARDRSLLTLGFCTALRRCNLRALDLADITFLGSRRMLVQVRRSKTDQEGKGKTLRIFPGEHESTCPYRALKDWLAIRGMDPGPLFTATYKHRWGQEVTTLQRLNGERIGQVVKRALRMIGESDDSYGAHSLRAGFCTTARQEGADALAIMEVSGHKSLAMLQRYLRPGPEEFPARSPLGRAV